MKAAVIRRAGCPALLGRGFGCKHFFPGKCSLELRFLPIPQNPSCNTDLKHLAFPQGPQLITINKHQQLASYLEEQDCS